MCSSFPLCDSTLSWVSLLTCGCLVGVVQCVNTFDEHEDRVWAVAVRRARNGTGDDEMVTGGSDSVRWQAVACAQPYCVASHVT